MQVRAVWDACTPYVEELMHALPSAVVFCTIHLVYIGLLAAADKPEVLGINSVVTVNAVVVVVVEGSVVVSPVIGFVGLVVPPPVEDVLPGDVPKSQVVVNVLEDDPMMWSVII